MPNVGNELLLGLISFSSNYAAILLKSDICSSLALIYATQLTLSQVSSLLFLMEIILICVFANKNVLQVNPLRIPNRVEIICFRGFFWLGRGEFAVGKLAKCARSK